MDIYVPGTQERDLQKVIMSLQQVVTGVGDVEVDVGALQTAVTGAQTDITALQTAIVQKIKTVVVQKFTASGTYTPTTGMVFCANHRSRMAAAGGGGGTGSDRLLLA